MAKRRRVRRFLARHRRSGAVRRLAAWSDWTRRACENFDYDSRYNGEAFVLEALRGQGLSCFFDVGANVGDWATLAHEIHPEAVLHCFEVMPDTADKLRVRMAGIPGVAINAFGLSDHEGPVSVSYFPDRVKWTTIVDYPHGHRRVDVPSEVTTGDAYLKRHGLERIDLLKIDVEGAEHLVLAGFAEALAGDRIDAVQFEYGRVSILTKFLLRDFYELFDRQGYDVGKIYPNYVDFRPYEVDDENFLGPNYLAVRRERRGWIELLR